MEESGPRIWNFIIIIIIFYYYFLCFIIYSTVIVQWRNVIRKCYNAIKGFICDGVWLEFKGNNYRHIIMLETIFPGALIWNCVKRVFYKNRKYLIPFHYVVRLIAFLFILTDLCCWWFSIFWLVTTVFLHVMMEYFLVSNIVSLSIHRFVTS